MESPFIGTFTAEVQGDTVIVAFLSSQRAYKELVVRGAEFWGVGTLVDGTHLGYNQVLTFDHIQFFDPWQGGIQSEEPQLLPRG
jgi:hypothetical protein